MRVLIILLLLFVIFLFVPFFFRFYFYFSYEIRMPRRTEGKQPKKKKKKKDKAKKKGPSERRSSGKKISRPFDFSVAPCTICATCGRRASKGFLVRCGSCKWRHHCDFRCRTHDAGHSSKCMIKHRRQRLETAAVCNALMHKDKFSWFFLKHSTRDGQVLPMDVAGFVYQMLTGHQLTVSIGEVEIELFIDDHERASVPEFGFDHLGRRHRRVKLIVDRDHVSLIGDVLQVYYSAGRTTKCKIVSVRTGAVKSCLTPAQYVDLMSSILSFVDFPALSSFCSVDFQVNAVVHTELKEELEKMFDRTCSKS